MSRQLPGDQAESYARAERRDQVEGRPIETSVLLRATGVPDIRAYRWLFRLAGPFCSLTRRGPRPPVPLLSIVNSGRRTSHFCSPSTGVATMSPINRNATCRPPGNVSRPSLVTSRQWFTPLFTWMT